MSETDSVLRGLIRLLPVARSLHDEAEKSMHMELPLSGDLAVTALKGLAAAVARISADPYVQSLSEAFASGSYASDKEKVTAVLFVAGQLVAYIEGEIGLSQGNQAPRQYAPNVNIMDVQGVSSEMLAKLAGIGQSEQ
jgi:hypothetical protein